MNMMVDDNSFWFHFPLIASLKWINNKNQIICNRSMVNRQKSQIIKPVGITRTHWNYCSELILHNLFRMMMVMMVMIRKFVSLILEKTWTLIHVDWLIRLILNFWHHLLEFSVHNCCRLSMSSDCDVGKKTGLRENNKKETKKTKK